jgi:hypothetical protein
MGLEHGGGDLSALPPRLWVEPWSSQIRADLDAVDLLVRQGQRSSTVCMLLQMVFEKLTKLALNLGRRPFPSEHKCVEHLIGVLKRSPRMPVVYLPNRDVLRFVLYIEELNPSVAKAKRAEDPLGAFPQLEYPWEDLVAGKVMSPATDLPILSRLRDPDDQTLIRTIRFAHYLLRELPNLVCAYSAPLSAATMPASGSSPPTLSTRPSREISTFVGRVSVSGS